MRQAIAQGQGSNIPVVVNSGITSTSFGDGGNPGEISYDSSGNKYVWDGTSWVQTNTGGAAHVAEVGIPNSRHSRYETTIGYNVLGTVTFIQAENVRRYRVLPSADMRVAEDAINDTQAGAWLNQNAANTASVDTDVLHWLALADVWSEWKELSKNSADPSLSRLDFTLDAAGTGATVFVEAE